MERGDIHVEPSETDATVAGADSIKSDPTGRFGTGGMETTWNTITARAPRETRGGWLLCIRHWP